MTTASKLVKKASAPKPKDPNSLRVVEQEGESQARRAANLGLSPVVVGALTATRFAKGAIGEIDITEAVAVTRERIGKVKSGDMSGVESTLMAQAMTLDSIFNEMARRAALNMGEHLAATETYLKMAFKAQSQCRSTLETLAEVKAPRVATFIKQANIANQQQVNNGSAGTGGNESHPRGENIIQSNELLEAHHGERLDTRAQGKASGNDPHLEAVGAVHGAAHG
jgi:hypothetical protein